VEWWLSRRHGTKTFSCFYIVKKIITRFALGGLAQTDDFFHYNQGRARKSFLTYRD
jgi:hypothetical protein